MPTQHWLLFLLAARQRTMLGAVGRTYLSVCMYGLGSLGLSWVVVIIWRGLMDSVVYLDFMTAAIAVFLVFILHSLLCSLRETSPFFRGTGLQISCCLSGANPYRNSARVKCMTPFCVAVYTSVRGTYQIQAAKSVTKKKKKRPADETPRQYAIP